MPVHPLSFGDPGTLASRELLRRFDALAPAGRGELRERLALLERLDRRHGGAGVLPLEAVDTLVDALVQDLVPLGDPDLVIGVGLWAIRHQVAFHAVEPVVNALAERSNGTREREALSAIVGLMHGLAQHLHPVLGADLERSNPERPWRILHANLAITAIRTEDPQLMALAFDALDAALPDERATFYAEATALALAPGIAPAVREALAARHAKWTQG